MPCIPTYGGEVEIHDRTRPWSFACKCFRIIVREILRKDTGGYYTRAFHPKTAEDECWWYCISAGANNSHAQVRCNSLFGDNVKWPEPGSFGENEVLQAPQNSQ